MRITLASRLAVFIVAALFAAPFVMPWPAEAQTPNVGSPNAIQCPNLSRNLSRGMQGQDVRELQQFLVAYGSLSQANFNTGPGYYGSRTEAAVKDFQCKEGVVCSGSPSSTGWGAVGSRTKAAIARTCRGGTTPTPPPPPPVTVTMTATPLSGVAPLVVAFSITASSNTCYSYTLDFGDGKTESINTFCGARTIQHTYPSSGNFSAHLDQLVPSNGQIVRQVKAQAAISVGAPIVEPPTCTMTASKTTINPNESVTLTWSSNHATSAQWSGGASTGTSGSAVFVDITTSTTKTIVFSGTGGTKACSVTIAVTPPPNGSVTASGNAIANGATVTLPTQGQSAFKLAEFTLKIGSEEAVTLKKFAFTVRNQTSDANPGAATVSNYRATIGTNTYTVTTTKDGVYENATVSLGSGVSLGAGESKGIAIFADIVPASGGTIDLWIYPVNMEFTGNTTGLAVVPTSNVTNRVDSALLYWSGWISVVREGGGGGGGGGISRACVLNGQGFDIDPEYYQCSLLGGSATYDWKSHESCRKYLGGEMICTENGWTGGNVTTYGVKVACTSSNGLFIPGNQIRRGNRCTTQNGQTTNCEQSYVCRNDGWWVTDSAGNQISKFSELPYIYEESPPYNPP